MLRKKIWAPAGIEPTTFQIQVGRTNHWAIGKSYGEQVAGQDFASHEYAGLKQSNTLTYSTCIPHPPSKCCVHFEATLVPCTCTCISYIFCNTTWAFIQKHDILMCESNIHVHIAAGTACNTVLIIMRTEVVANRGHVSLYCWHVWEVDSSSTLQACQR